MQPRYNVSYQSLLQHVYIISGSAIDAVAAALGTPVFRCVPRGNDPASGTPRDRLGPCALVFNGNAHVA